MNTEIGTFTLDEIGALIQQLGPQAAHLIAAKGGEPFKDGNLTLGQDEALRNRLLGSAPSGERQAIIAEILRGEIEITLKRVGANQFDKNGRLVPFAYLKHQVANFDSRYAFPVYSHSYVWHNDQIKALRECYAKEFPHIKFEWPTAKNFYDRVQEIIRKLASDPATAQAVKNDCLPFIIPGGFVGECKFSYLDNMQRLAGVFDRVYNMPFHGHGRGQRRQSRIWNIDYDMSKWSDGKARPVARHDRLASAVENGKLVIGVAFPALGGYSPKACREAFCSSKQSRDIPDHLMLGGGYDTLAVLMTNQKIFRTSRFPTIAMPGLRCLLHGVDDQSMIFQSKTLAHDKYLILELDRDNGPYRQTMSFITCIG